MKLVTLLLVILLYSPRTPFEARYAEEYRNASMYCNSISETADTIAKRYGLKRTSLLPIVFPECARYSSLSDQFETAALEYFYVHFGKDYANFSIGHFQMKPSFIERLEEEVKTTPLVHEFSAIVNYPHKDPVQMREERVMRMQDDAWQIRYLCCFFKVMDHRYKEKQWKSEEDKIAFYAAAYNRGFWYEESEIRKWEKLCSFPSGSIDPENNYPYAEVAREYFVRQGYK